jgi:hypothetical protein
VYPPKASANRWLISLNDASVGPINFCQDWLVRCISSIRCKVAGSGNQGNFAGSAEGLNFNGPLNHAFWVSGFSRAFGSSDIWISFLDGVTRDPSLTAPKYRFFLITAYAAVKASMASRGLQSASRSKRGIVWATSKGNALETDVKRCSNTSGLAQVKFLRLLRPADSCPLTGPIL